MKSILRRIRKQREAKGYTQENVADNLEISQKAYCDIENGINKLSLERFIKISEFLETDPIDLLDDKVKIDLIKQANCDICPNLIKMVEFQKRLKIYESNTIFLQDLLKQLGK